MRVDKNLAKEIGSYWESKGLFASTMMEECGELTQAISKVARVRRQFDESSEEVTQEADDALYETEEKLEREIADMYIVLKVLETKWYLSEDHIQKYIDEKLDKKYEHNI